MLVVCISFPAGAFPSNSSLSRRLHAGLCATTAHREPRANRAGGCELLDYYTVYSSLDGSSIKCRRRRFSFFV